MKYLYLTFLVLSFSNNYGQMSSFLKTTEYEKIKKEVGTIDYYSWSNVLLGLRIVYNLKQ